MLLKDYYNQQARLQKAGLVSYEGNLFEGEYDSVFGNLTVDFIIKELKKLKESKYAWFEKENDDNVASITFGLIDSPCREVLWRLVY